jgi:hypothetical protein
MSKQFASHADLEGKKVGFDKLSDRVRAYTAEGGQNTGIVVGDDAVMVIDAQAAPVMAQDVIRRIREVTDKPIFATSCCRITTRCACWAPQPTARATSSRARTSGT